MLQRKYRGLFMIEKPLKRKKHELYLNCKDPELNLKYRCAVEELHKRKNELSGVLSNNIKIVHLGYGRKYLVNLPHNIGFAEFNVSDMGILTIKRVKIGPHFEGSSLRGLGLGRLIIKKVIEFARRRGIKYIGVNSAPLAVDFYKKLGFKQVDPNSYYFFIKL